MFFFKKKKKKKTEEDEIDFNIGTISFPSINDIQKIDWMKDNVLVNIIKDGNGLFIQKSDGKLKCYHVILGRGRTDVEADVSHLDNEKNYVVAFTWNVKSNLEIYIDGEKLASTPIIKQERRII